MSKAITPMKTSKLEFNKNLIIILLAAAFLAYKVVNESIPRLVIISIIVGLLFVYLYLTKSVSRKLILVQALLLIGFLLMQFFI